MTPNFIPREEAQAPRKPAASVQGPREACAVACGERGKGDSAPAGTTRGRQWPPPAATAATGSGQEGWAGLTFTLPAFPLVAWLAEAFVGLGRVLADGIDVAVIRALRALVHVDWPCVRGGRGNAGEVWPGKQASDRGKEHLLPPALPSITGVINRNGCHVTIWRDK